jgi:hypothetical protein
VPSTYVFRSDSERKFCEALNTLGLLQVGTRYIYCIGRYETAAKDVACVCLLRRIRLLITLYQLLPSPNKRPDICYRMLRIDNYPYRVAQM